MGRGDMLRDVVTETFVALFTIDANKGARA